MGASAPRNENAPGDRANGPEGMNPTTQLMNEGAGSMIARTTTPAKARTAATETDRTPRENRFGSGLAIVATINEDGVRQWVTGAALAHSGPRRVDRTAVLVAVDQVDQAAPCITIYTPGDQQPLSFSIAGANDLIEALTAAATFLEVVDLTA